MLPFDGLLKQCADLLAAPYWKFHCCAVNLPHLLLKILCATWRRRSLSESVASALEEASPGLWLQLCKKRLQVCLVHICFMCITCNCLLVVLSGFDSSTTPWVVTLDATDGQATYPAGFSFSWSQRSLCIHNTLSSSTCRTV